MRPRSVVWAGFAFLLATYLFAQATSRLTGSIIESSGAAVPGATVEVYLPGGEKPLSVLPATGEGIFAFTGLAAGKYDVVITSQGFRKHTDRGVILTAGAETSMPAIRLEVGSVAETVEVMDTTINVQTNNA